MISGRMVLRGQTDCSRSSSMQSVHTVFPGSTEESEKGGDCLCSYYAAGAEKQQSGGSRTAIEYQLSVS